MTERSERRFEIESRDSRGEETDSRSHGGTGGRNEGDAETDSVQCSTNPKNGAGLAVDVVL